MDEPALNSAIETLFTRQHELLSALREVQISLESHIAAEGERDKALFKAVDGIIQQVQCMDRLLTRGQGVIGALILAGAGIWALWVWLSEHYSLVAK